MERESVQSQREGAAVQTAVPESAPQEGEEQELVCGEPALLDDLAKLYSLCKRLLLNTPWHSREITGSQRVCLLILAGHGPMTMTQLAKAMACSKEQATRATAPLVEKGYVYRQYDRDNRTRVWVALSDAGRALIRQEYAAALGGLHNLSTSDRQRFREALDTISQLMLQLQS